MKKLLAFAGLLAAVSIASAAALPRATSHPDLLVVPEFLDMPSTLALPQGLRGLAPDVLAQTCAVSNLMLARGIFRTVMTTELPSEEGVRLMVLVTEHLLTTIVWLADADKFDEKNLKALSEAWVNKPLEDTLSEGRYCKDAGMETFLRLDETEKDEIRQAAEEVLELFGR